MFFSSIIYMQGAGAGAQERTEKYLRIYVPLTKITHTGTFTHARKHARAKHQLLHRGAELLAVEAPGPVGIQ